MIPIYITSAFIIYFMILFVFSNFIKAGQSTRSVHNSKLDKFRAEYNVTIRSFQKNSNHYGFSWIKSIWINDNIVGKNDLFLFVFFHELYHLKHHHKIYTLILRFSFPLVWLLGFIFPWFIVIIYAIILAAIIQIISDRFEKKANDYAKKMYNERNEAKKR